ENLLSYGVDIDYFDVMGMDITHGDFKEVLRSSENGRVVSLVNSTFVKKFGWQDSPINKKITLRPGTENELQRKVSGVFRDFHFYSLKEKITPQIISLRPDPGFVNTNLLIRYHDGANLQQAVASIEEAWYRVQPNLPLQYELMEESVRKLYQRERQTGYISSLFSLLAILLSVFGLVGFMIYIIGLKSKELTIRKVLGASPFQLIAVLIQQLWWIILIAGVVGSLLSYHLIRTWLQEYAYKIAMHPIAFISALIIVYLIVLTITALRAMQWARTNPVITLNEE
ncbi:MAG: FtsX-like permease family protein, partial [Bacteroidota bacterium]